MEFAFSDRCQELRERLLKFMDDHVYPSEQIYDAQLVASGNPHSHPPVMEELKEHARAAGLWNLFLPHEEDGSAALSNTDYAPLAEIMGRSHIASEACNCSAPDTGNMEVLTVFGSREQKDRWLVPLLEGEIRSAFAMTEPDVASSDATNVEMRIERDGDEYVLNGRKWWTSGAMSDRCKIFIVMGKTDPDGPTYRQQSMILVEPSTPGVTIVRNLPVFGYVDQEGHAEVTFENVRVPASNLIANEGDGFLISQARLGPGRIHHCMRAIGAAERALELMCARAGSRVTFGKPVADPGQRPGLDRRVADRDRDGAPAHAEGGMVDGHGRQQARPHGDRRDQGRGPQCRAARRRSRDPGPRWRRRLRRLPARHDVRPPANAAARRRTRRDPQAHNRPPRTEGCISLPVAMRNRGRLAAVVAISTAVWCLTAAGATAKTLCVNDPACVTGGGTAEDTIADALNAATSAHSTDPTNAVKIGPGTYVGAYAFSDSNQVTIEGAGEGRTVLQFGGIIDIGLYLNGNSADSVSGLSIVAASGTSPAAAGIQIEGGQLDHVAVDMTADGSQAEGVTMGAGLLTNSSVTVENAPGATAVLSFGTSVLADDTLSGGVGYSNGSGTSVLTRTRITAGTDGILCHVTCVASSSLIEMGPGAEAGLLATGFSSSCGSVTASNLTIVGAALVAAGSRCTAPGKTASLTIDSSVLSGRDPRARGRGRQVKRNRNRHPDLRRLRPGDRRPGRARVTHDLGTRYRLGQRRPAVPESRPRRLPDPVQLAARRRRQPRRTRFP